MFDEGIMTIIYDKKTGEIIAWGDEWQDYGLLGYDNEKFKEAEKKYGILKTPFNHELKGNEKHSKVINGTELVITAGQVSAV